MIKKLLLISIFWGVLILVLSSIPGSSLPKTPTIPHFDKLVHAGLYFILSSFLMPVIALSNTEIIRKISPLIVLVITIIYGGFIEIAQENWFINRSGDILDFLSDIAGSILAIIFYYVVVRKRFRSLGD